jgi:hypothetical protein
MHASLISLALIEIPYLMFLATGFIERGYWGDKEDSKGYYFG